MCIEREVENKNREKETILHAHDNIKLINVHLVCCSCLKEEEKRNEKLDKAETEKMKVDEYRKDVVEHLDMTSDIIYCLADLINERKDVKSHHLKCENVHIQSLKLKLEEANDVDSIRITCSDYKWMLRKIASWKRKRFCGAVRICDSEMWFLKQLESHENSSGDL